MDLQFFIDDESLETLCFHYILNQKQKSKTMIINSILMKLVSTSNANLYQLFQTCCSIVDENKTQNSSRSMIDKEYYKNIATLIKQVIAKYPKIINTANEQQLADIIKFSCAQVFCAVSGNDYISLIAMIIMRTNQNSNALLQIVQKMVLNSKMQVTSYRQVTRLQLYWLLLRVLSGKSAQQLTSEYMSRIIHIVQSEKNPRNISCVFQIYEILLNSASTQNIEPVKKKIFDCLEAYYPIDFEGDADQHKIKLHDISVLLDRCLTHPIFSTEIRALLMTKMGAAPVGKYISTLVLTRNHMVTPDSLTFLENLLLRTCQEQYLQEQYEQDAQYTLADLQIQLLNRLYPKHSPIAASSYNAIVQWLHVLLVGKILDCEQNSKHAGFIIGTLKSIMNKCNTNVRFLICSYCVHGFLTHYKGAGDVVYKLGMLVPVLDHSAQLSDVQKKGLLILTLAQVFHTSEQAQPRLIVLKLYMQLSGGGDIFKKMISQTNIWHSCMQAITCASGDTKIVKAYIDFVVQLYHNNPKVQQVIVSHSRVDMQMYGLVVLANKAQGMYSKLEQILVQAEQGEEKGEQVYKELIAVLRMLKIQAVLQTIAHVPSQVPQEHATAIIGILAAKHSPIQYQEQDQNQQYNNNNGIDSNGMGFIDKYVVSNMMLYFTKHIYRPYLPHQQTRNTIKAKLQAWIKEQENNHYCQTTTAYYNKSMLAFNLPQDEMINNQHITSSASYNQQLHRMLPIQHQHHYTGEECKEWPTLVHYCWKQSNGTRTDLIQYLPTSILVAEAHKILPVILPKQDVETLCKILKSIPSSTITSTIIPFAVQFLQQVTQDTHVQKIVAVNKILHDLHAMAKDHQDIHDTLIKSKGKVLVAIEERLLQHRKRRPRQSSRVIFSIYNSFK